jgi:hypothetical protein
MAKFLEFAADSLEIEDFSVKDQPIACLRIMHRHVPGRGQIQNGEPPRAQAHTEIGVGSDRKEFSPFVVRPPMSHCPRALLERPVNFGRAFAD